MNWDEWKAGWESALRAKGHTPVENDNFGGVDWFVTDRGYHNGPGCATCGWTTCMHCNPDADDIPKCTATEGR